MKTQELKPIEEIEKLPPIERLEYLEHCPNGMVPYPALRRRAKADLIQWYMNAVTTEAGSGGHGKAERNEQAAKYYKEQMTAWCPLSQ